MGSQCLMRVEFLLGDDENVLEIVMIAHTINVLNAIESYILNANCYVIHILPQLLKVVEKMYYRGWTRMGQNELNFDFLRVTGWRAHSFDQKLVVGLPASDVNPIPPRRSLLGSHRAGEPGRLS